VDGLSAATRFVTIDFDADVVGGREILLINAAKTVTVNAGVGGDKITGGDGREILFGAAGNDILLGGKGNDDLNGGIGNDTIDGGEGLDTFFASSITALDSRINLITIAYDLATDSDFVSFFN